MRRMIIPMVCLALGGLLIVMSIRVFRWENPKLEEVIIIGRYSVAPTQNWVHRMPVPNYDNAEYVYTSPDHRWLYMVAYPTGEFGIGNLYRIPTIEGQPKKIAENLGRASTRFAPDGSWFVYATTDAVGPSQFMWSKADGSAHHFISPLGETESGRSDLIWGFFSPDSQWYYFQVADSINFDTSNYDIWRVGRDGQALTNLTAAIDEPVWGVALPPDQPNQIELWNSTTIYTMRLDGSELESRAVEPAPVLLSSTMEITWITELTSPDGEWTVNLVLNDQSKQWEIHRTGRDGQTARLRALPKGPDYSFFAFTPDSQWLVYQIYDFPQSRQYFQINMDGHGARKVEFPDDDGADTKVAGQNWTLIGIRKSAWPGVTLVGVMMMAVGVGLGLKTRA